MQNDEFERTPVTPGRLQPARHFAANYAGEHVAGTEFVIGAMFVAWGVSTGDILWGLLWGNLMAVLSWGLVCAPIAVQTRLTLYAYLEKIGGPGMIRVYSVVNGVLFCILAGTMITVSASAMRIPLGIAPQVDWYPTSAAFVALVLAIGAVVVWIALRGFRGVARFAEVCAPWMVLMFVLGAMAMLPVLAASTEGVQASSGIADFGTIADRWIWQGTGAGSVGMWHVAAFAWICNLAMHGGLSDMSVLRFARRPSYGFLSAIGMFIGHYMAWVCAGIMGAGAALLLKSSISVLDPGAVAYQALGSAGIVAVIVAGWTTANPTIYRAGLAFQSLNPRWDRARVTMITGGVTTVIACFPFVFSRLMDFVGIMGLTLAPVGAVIVAEHWLFPRLGLTRYWSHYAGLRTNFAGARGMGAVVASRAGAGLERDAASVLPADPDLDRGNRDLHRPRQHQRCARRATPSRLHAMRARCDSNRPRSGNTWRTSNCGAHSAARARRKPASAVQPAVFPACAGVLRVRGAGGLQRDDRTGNAARLVDRADRDLPRGRDRSGCAKRNAVIRKSRRHELHAGFRHRQDACEGNRVRCRFAGRRAPPARKQRARYRALSASRCRRPVAVDARGDAR